MRRLLPIMVVVATAAGCGDSSSTLVRVDSEPEGGNCASGGVAIHTGTDTNNNDYLDTDEITSTQYVCNGVSPVQCRGGTILTGTVAISADEQLDELSGVDCVDGDLLITGIEGTLPALQLSVVTGDIVIAGNPALTTLRALESLPEVGGTYLLQGNDALTDLTGIGGLQRAQAITIVGNDALVDLEGFEPLQTLDATLTVANNASLTSLHGMENIVTASRTIAIRSNPSLTSLEGLYHLRSAQLLEISGNGELRGVALADLETIEVRLLVLANARATVISLPALKTVGDFVRIEGNGVETIDTPELVTIGGLHLVSSPALATVHAESLVFVTNTVELTTVPALRDITLPALTSIGGSLRIRAAAQLANLHGFSALTGIGGELLVDSDVVTNFSGLDKLVRVSGDMTVMNNGQLSSFSGLEALDEVGGALTITNNPMLPASAATDFASRITVHGAVTIN